MNTDEPHVFVRVLQFVPRLHIRSLHELLCQLGRCISTRFLHSGNERLGLCQLGAFLRLLFSSSCNCFELRRGIDVVELRSELNETVETCEVELS